MKHILSLLFVGAFLFGCTNAPEGSPSPAAASPSPSRPAATPMATASPSPAPPSCLSRKGVFDTGEYTNPELPRSIPYRVYLPPCFDEAPGPYPILLMLHGLLATDRQWEDLGIGDVADRLITAGQAPPFLIVLPWERKGLEYESALVDFLLPYVQERYDGAEDRDRIAVGGLSRGGGWALRIGLQHPDIFGAIGLHSPAVLTPDLYDLPDWVAAIRTAHRPRLWIDIGDHDSLRASVFELTSLLDNLGYPYVWTFDPGDHTPEYWSSHLESYLRWYVQAW